MGACFSDQSSGQPKAGTLATPELAGLYVPVEPELWTSTRLQLGQPLAPLAPDFEHEKATARLRATRVNVADASFDDLAELDGELQSSPTRKTAKNVEAATACARWTEDGRMMYTVWDMYGNVADTGTLVAARILPLKRNLDLSPWDSTPSDGDDASPEHPSSPQGRSFELREGAHNASAASSASDGAASAGTSQATSSGFLNCKCEYHCRGTAGGAPFAERLVLRIRADGVHCWDLGDGVREFWKPVDSRAAQSCKPGGLSRTSSKNSTTSTVRSGASSGVEVLELSLPAATPSKAQLHQMGEDADGAQGARGHVSDASSEVSSTKYNVNATPVAPRPQPADADSSPLA